MLKLVDQNIVVLGSINPAIIQPNWLSKLELIPKGEKIEAKISIGPGSSTEYRWGKRYTWTVDQLSLKISVPPESPRTELTKFITTVFGALSHTPVTATGQNFLFEGNPEDINAEFFHKEDWGLTKKKKWGRVARLRHEITFEEGEARKVNIYLTKNHEKAVVQINFHYEASDTLKVIEYSKEVEDNCKLASDILKEVASQ